MVQCPPPITICQSIAICSQINDFHAIDEESNFDEESSYNESLYGYKQDPAGSYQNDDIVICKVDDEYFIKRIGNKKENGGYNKTRKRQNDYLQNMNSATSE